MGRKLFLLETENQTTDYLEKYQDERTELIALSPFVMNVLDSCGIPYYLPEDFYGPEEVWQVGKNVFKQVQELCLRLDDFALSKSEELKKRNIKLYTYYNYGLYRIFDAVFMRIFQLKAILRKLKPEEVFFYLSKKYPFYWRGVGFDNRE